MYRRAASHCLALWQAYAPQVLTVPLSPVRVLIVDDDDDNRMMYAEFLATTGFDVHQACTAEEALVMAAALVPHVIMMDVTLPVMNGVDAVRHLRADPRTRGISVIVLSGHAEPDSAREARAAGCDAFLTKPCLPDALLAEVTRLLANPPAR